jgi:hypothetical protein
MAHERNPSERLPETGSPLPDFSGWDRRRTALLVIHGIGDQVPLETLDGFGRTLAETLALAPGARIEVTHHLAKKAGGRPGEVWFDNVLRLRDAASPEGCHLDLYEYYWANKTEDKVRSEDIQQWVSEVTRGARRFYKENAELARSDEPKGAFTSNGRFHGWRYRFFLGAIGVLIPAVSAAAEGVLKAAAWLPVVGGAFRALLTTFFSGSKKRLVNTIGDIVVYTTSDRRSQFYEVRQEILRGAVGAFRYLLEVEDGRHRYDRVVLAGHSLGTQVAYDAVNRLVHELDEGQVNGWKADGTSAVVDGLRLDQLFSGFVTFGSPLDKIAFFLREQVPAEQYLRKQLVSHYHSFKQRDWNPHWRPPFVVATPFARRLDSVPWRNYYDQRDYVSGSLDFYRGLTNVDARLPKSLFTHNDYWSHRPMYLDILSNFLKG